MTAYLPRSLVVLERSHRYEAEKKEKAEGEPKRKEFPAIKDPAIVNHPEIQKLIGSLGIRRFTIVDLTRARDVIIENFIVTSSKFRSGGFSKPMSSTGYSSWNHEIVARCLRDIETTEHNMHQMISAIVANAKHFPKVATVSDNNAEVSLNWWQILSLITSGHFITDDGESATLEMYGTPKRMSSIRYNLVTQNGMYTEQEGFIIPDNVGTRVVRFANVAIDFRIVESQVEISEDGIAKMRNRGVTIPDITLAGDYRALHSFGGVPIYTKKSGDYVVHVTDLNPLSPVSPEGVATKKVSVRIGTTDKGRFMPIIGGVIAVEVRRSEVDPSAPTELIPLTTVSLHTIGGLRSVTGRDPNADNLIVDYYGRKLSISTDNKKLGDSVKSYLRGDGFSGKSGELGSSWVGVYNRDSGKVEGIAAIGDFDEEVSQGQTTMRFMTRREPRAGINLKVSDFAYTDFPDELTPSEQEYFERSYDKYVEMVGRRDVAELTLELVFPGPITSGDGEIISLRPLDNAAKLANVKTIEKKSFLHQLFASTSIMGEKPLVVIGGSKASRERELNDVIPLANPISKAAAFPTSGIPFFTIDGRVPVIVMKYGKQVFSSAISRYLGALFPVLENGVLIHKSLRTILSDAIGLWYDTHSKSTKIIGSVPLVTDFFFPTPGSSIEPTHISDMGMVFDGNVYASFAAHIAYGLSNKGGNESCVVIPTPGAFFFSYMCIGASYPVTIISKITRKSTLLSPYAKSSLPEGESIGGARFAAGLAVEAGINARLSSSVTGVCFPSRDVDELSQ
jgi:hypothetical protein